LIGHFLFSRSAGYWAALLHALLLGGVWVAEFGEPDHHVMESFFVALLFFQMLKFCASDQTAQSLDRASLLSLAVVMALSQLMWRGAIMYLLLFTAAIVFSGTISHFSIHNRDTTMIARKFLFLACSLVVLIYLILPVIRTTYFGQRSSFVYYALSLFQPTVYLITACFLLALYLLFKNPPKQPGSLLNRKTAFRTLVLLLVISACFLFLRTPVVNSLLDGVSYILKTDPWMNTILETRPLVSLNAHNPWSDALAFFGYWIVLYPMILIALLLKKRSMPVQFFLIWAAFNFLLTLLQIRYTHQLMLTLSLVSGLTLAEISKYVRNLCTRFVPGLMVRKTAPVMITIIFFLFLSKPGLENMIGYYITRYEREGSVPLNLLETMLWIKENTPQTSYFCTPDQKPEYGIMSIWDFGNWINFIAQRPVVASNFGFLQQGLITSCQFMTTSNWQVAEEILVRNQVRYIIMGNFSARQSDFRQILSSMAPETLQVDENHGWTVADRLYRLDGCLSGLPPARCSFLDSIRLIYESAPDPSNQTCRQRSNFLVYEYVPGARCSISGHNNEDYSLSVVLETNQKRRFVYRQFGPLGDTGEVTVRLPYATMQLHDAVHTTGPYLLEIGQRKYNLQVATEEVLEGKDVVFVKEINCQTH